MSLRLTRSSLALLALALCVAPAHGQVTLPAQPRQYVEDLANTINANHERALNGLLQELKQKTGIQYIVLTIPTTGGQDIAQFSVELAHDKWKLGQADKDNGFLFVIATADRDYWFTPGYELEGYLTDQYLGQVGRDILKPYLQQNNYSEGIYQANLTVVSRIAGEERITLTGMPVLPRQGQPSRRDPRLPCCGSLLPLLFLLFFIGGMGGRMGRGGGIGWFFLPFMFRGFGGHGGYGRSGSYGGGSFGGSFGGFGGGFGGGSGGFGGFGGGGGGGFSGGGAGGSW